MAPGYRGKPENFDFKKVVVKKTKPKPKHLDQKEEELHHLHPYTLNSTPTEQKNKPLLDDAIFAPDVVITEMDPLETFEASFARLPEIVTSTYRMMSTDWKQMDRSLAKEELSYYATSLLWLRLIDIKDKQGVKALSRAENQLKKSTEEIDFNVPQPIAVYLQNIGYFTDGMKKRTNIEVPDLQTTRAQGMGGYHTAAIDVQNHNLFEEVPSVGIAADIVMSLCQEADEPVPNFRIGLPEGAVLHLQDVTIIITDYNDQGSTYI